MVTAQIFLYVTIITLGLFFLGRHFKDYTTGILGGLGFFMLGFTTFITPISDVPELLSLTLASIGFGLGAYIWITGSLELLKDKGYLS